jgi:hypothetical protein
MPSLDLRSLTAMSGVMAVVLGLVLLGVRANYPASIRGLSYWGTAPLWCALAAVLFVFNGVLPKGILLLCGNGFLMLGFAFFLFGSQRFLGQPVTWLRCLCLGAVALSAMAYFQWIHPDYRLRVLVFTSTLALICVSHVRLLLGHGKGFATYLAAGMLSIQVLVLLFLGALGVRRRFAHGQRTRAVGVRAFGHPRQPDRGPDAPRGPGDGGGGDAALAALPAAVFSADAGCGPFQADQRHPWASDG